jgi:hypothetical protein
MVTRIKLLIEKTKKKICTTLEPKTEFELKPYLLSILKFYNLEEDKLKEVYFPQKEKLSTNTETFSINNNNSSSKIFSEEPFNSVFIELEDINVEQDTFLFQREEILKLLSLPLTQLQNNDVFEGFTKTKRNRNYNLPTSEINILSLENDDFDRNKDNIKLKKKPKIKKKSKTIIKA